MKSDLEAAVQAAQAAALAASTASKKELLGLIEAEQKAAQEAREAQRQAKEEAEVGKCCDWEHQTEKECYAPMAFIVRLAVPAVPAVPAGAPAVPAGAAPAGAVPAGAPAVPAGALVAAAKRVVGLPARLPRMLCTGDATRAPYTAMHRWRLPCPAKGSNGKDLWLCALIAA